MAILIRLIKSSILKLRQRAKEHSIPLFRPMSKTFRSFLFVFAAVIQILHFFNNANAQDLEIRIKIDAVKPAIVTIEGKRKPVAGKPTRNFSFLTSIAGQEISGERISKLKLFDSKGTPVPYKQFIPGEY